MKRLCCMLTVLALSLAALVPVASATDQNVPLDSFYTPTDVHDQPLGIALLGQGEYVSSAEVNNKGADVDIFNAGVGVVWRWFTLTYEFSSYNWDDPNKLPFGNNSGDPWDDLHMIRLDGRYEDYWSRDWGWFAGAGVVTGFESELDESFGGNIRAGLIYNLSHDWRVRFGLAAVADPIDSFFFPLLGFDYGDPKGKAKGFTASIGVPRTELRYRFGRDLVVRLDAKAQRKTYRLADDSDVQRKGYFRSIEGVAGLTLDYDLIEDLTASLGGTYHFARTFEIYDDDGDKNADPNVESAFGVLLGIRWAF